MTCAKTRAQIIRAAYECPDIHVQETLNLQYMYPELSQNLGPGGLEEEKSP